MIERNTNNNQLKEPVMMEYDDSQWSIMVNGRTLWTETATTAIATAPATATVQ